ncbi:MAG: carboxypeptidase regulatory-like domain-containing protein [Candidatus Korobacteraceae bacterium]
MFQRLLCVVLFAASLPAQQRQGNATVSHSYRIAGTVVNSVTGQPLASASVAIAPTSQGMERDISNSVTTGSDGHFSFDNLPRGKYSLMAMARGYTLQYFEHHDPYATAVAAGPDLDSEHLVFRLEPDASVEGEVSDENNDPIQNAMVRLFQTSLENGQQKTVQVGQTQTDDQGRYRMGRLAPGKYYLAVSARPWYAQSIRVTGKFAGADAQAEQEAAALDVTYPLTFYPDAMDSSSASPLTLTGGEKTTADVVLRATPSLHLRIRTGSSSTSPAFDRAVFPAVSQRIFEGVLDSVTNAPVSWEGPGVIDISGLAPGHYVVEMPGSSGLGEKATRRGWYRDIDLTGDAEISASDAPSFASVSGVMAFENEARVPKGAALELSNTDSGETFRSDISEKGEFDFSSEGVKPGHYLVRLNNTGGLFLSRLSATGAKVIGRTIEIAGTGSVRITAVAMRGAASVDGTAVRNDQPFAGAMIVLVPQDPGHNAPLFRRDESDSDGTFTLSNVVPGQYTVIAIANGWDLEWANPTVLQPYLKQGESVQVPLEGKLQIKVQVQ